MGYAMGETVELRQVGWHAARYALLSALMTAVCVAIVIGPFGGGLLGVVVGLPGALFFGAGTVALLRRWLGSGPTVYAGPDGVRDRRLAEDLIPWSTIQAMEFIDVHDPNAVVVSLSLQPEAADALRRGPLQQMQWGKDPDTGLASATVADDGLRGDVPAFTDLLKRHHPNWTMITYEALAEQVLGSQDGARRR